VGIVGLEHVTRHLGSINFRLPHAVRTTGVVRPAEASSANEKTGNAHQRIQYRTLASIDA